MSVSEAQKRASAKYHKKLGEIKVRVSPEEKALITEYAKLHHISVNELAKRAVYKYMENNQ